MGFNPKDLDQEKLKSLRDEAGFYQEFFDVSFAEALVLCSIHQIHDKLLDLNKRFDELLIEYDDDTPEQTIEGEEWKKRGESDV